MSEVLFADHTVESAPAGSRRSMEATTKHLGYLPAPVARLASSPHLLEGFLKVSGLFEATTLDAIAREVVILTMATRNGCHVCVAMHTAKLSSLMRVMTSSRHCGRASPCATSGSRRCECSHWRFWPPRARSSNGQLRTFLAQGYTSQNALEIVLGIGAYTMSTLANRMTQAPLDEQLQPFAWSEFIRSDR